MVVADHQVVRNGVTAMLADHDDIAVVAAAQDAAEALERCEQGGVDVVLMDLSLPGVDGATATALVVDRCPGVSVIVLTESVDEEPIRAAIQAGARGCLLKSVGDEDIAEAIRGVVRGRSTFSSEILPHLFGVQGDAADVHLTPRERDILSLLAGGQTNQSIADALGLRGGTVRVYVSAILAKLGAANRTEATVLAIRQGLVDTAQETPPRSSRRNDDAGTSDRDPA